jgi:hypothetical protein
MKTALLTGMFIISFIFFLIFPCVFLISLLFFSPSRDLKPDNVLLHHDTPTNAAVIKITDFGMSKQVTGDVVKQSQVGFLSLQITCLFFFDPLRRFRHSTARWSITLLKS